MQLPRHNDARQQVIDYLSSHGPVEDSNGKATAVLKSAVGYEGGDSGFVQLVSAMAKSGEITRDVRGKRTYRIWVSTASEPRAADRVPAPIVAPPTSQVTERSDSEIDYDELAATLLTRVTRLLSQEQEPTDDAPWARRRLERLEVRNTVLERDLARARADVEAVRQERDALATQLEAAQHNLTLLTERLGTPRPQAPRAASYLDTDERALLQRLRGNGRSQRAHPKSTARETL